MMMDINHPEAKQPGGFLARAGEAAKASLDISTNLALLGLTGVLTAAALLDRFTLDDEADFFPDDPLLGEEVIDG